MNKKQMAVLWVVLSILFVLSLFPMRETADGNQVKRGVVFQCSYSRFDPYNRYSRIDAETTLAQMLPVIIFGAGLLLAFKDKTKK